MKLLADNREYLMEYINKIIHGDCLEKLKELPENSIDSIVTDPPYELGFMGKSWDNTGIANNPLMWAECLRVLKPGGYLLSFGGTRTYHRMACAIEDAGFEVRDMIEWVYGSGFPKSLNIGKAVDKLQGNEREVEKHHIQSQTNPDIHAGGQVHITMPNNWKVTKGTSEWEGWGTALKPAHEPICMARKPLAEKTVAENVLKYGTGGINIDESRVGTEERTNKGMSSLGVMHDDNWKPQDVENTVNGRFPANLLHDNSEEVRECFPEQKSSGNRVNVEYKNPNKANVDFGGGIKNDYNDSGNASRFFKSIIYQAKASKSERNKGCEELEEKQTTGGGGLTADFREDGSLETASAGGKYGSIKAKQSNSHPTVKPIALMEYLIKMVTPKGGIVLDPFAGSGSTLVAAKQNGFNYVGIEMTEEYLPIINARLGL